MLGAFDKTNRPLVINAMMNHHGLSQEEAEGIWQESWIVLCIKVERELNGELPENLKGFMYGVCRNKMHEALREKEKRYAHYSLSETDAESFSTLDEMVSDWAMEADTSQQNALQRGALLDMALNALPDKQRKLICGYYYEDKSMRQLAAELGFMNERVAITTKQRAINTMKEFVSNHKLFHVYSRCAA